MIVLSKKDILRHSLYYTDNMFSYVICYTDINRKLYWTVKRKIFNINSISGLWKRMILD